MSRSMTASIQRLSPFKRLSFYLALREASQDTRIAANKQAMYRAAARYVHAFIDSPDYDIMLRLQVLEGASTGQVGQGSWWKQGKRGLEAARDALSGHPVDPSWFSQGNTGMIGKVMAMMKSAYRGWSSSYTMVSGVEDMVTNMLMGLGASGEPMPQGPVAIQVGAKNPGVQKGVLSGKETPNASASIIGKLVVKKIGDTLTRGDRSRAPNQTPEGDSVFDMMEKGQGDIFAVLADLVADPRSPVHRLMQSAIESHIGQGKWADIARELFAAELLGIRVKKQDMAAKHDMAPGTLSKVIRVKVKPAIDKLKKDRQFKQRVMDLAEREMRRRFASALSQRIAGLDWPSNGPVITD